MKRLATAAAALALGVAPANASVDAESATPAADARAVYETGRCVLRAGRETATRLLSELPIGGGDVPASAQTTIAAAGCGGAMPPDASILLRGAIAQELYFTDFQEFGVAPRNRGAWVDLALPVESAAQAGGDATAQLYEWADCVVRNDTGTTELLLKAPVGSRRETALLERMRPYMSACLDPDGRLAVAPSELRSVFAQAAYHSLFRYWGGELRQASHGGIEYAPGGPDGGPNAVTCRRYPVVGSRVRTARLCFTEAEWQKAYYQIRNWYMTRTQMGIQPPD